MKPQQLAALLNIAPSTLRQWAGKDYVDYLSPTGQGLKGARRSFNEMDSRILAWVALMKAQNMPANDIHATLKSAQSSQWKDLPPLPGGMANDEPIAVVPREAVEERVRALQERYELQLQATIKERDELRKRLETVENEAQLARREAAETIKALQRESADTFKTWQHESAETAKSLQERITKLTAQEAELRGKLGQYTIGGQQRSAASLIIVGLSVGIILMAVVVAIALFVSTRGIGAR